MSLKLSGKNILQAKRFGTKRVKALRRELLLALASLLEKVLIS